MHFTDCDYCTKTATVTLSIGCIHGRRTVLQMCPDDAERCESEGMVAELLGTPCRYLKTCRLTVTSRAEINR